jgi:uncharacterized damage-inducible protein DinB
MTPTDTIAKTLEANDALVSMALEGLTDEDLLKQPHPDCNPIGWLLLHQTRTEDNILSRFSGKPSVWDQDKWFERIQAPGGPGDGNAGNTIEQVRTFRATKADLLAYAHAMRENTLAVLPTITPDTLSRAVEDPPLPFIQKENDFLAVLLTDYSHHSGQICYLRGYLNGMGWMQF